MLSDVNWEFWEQLEVTQGCYFHGNNCGEYSRTVVPVTILLTSHVQGFTTCNSILWKNHVLCIFLRSFIFSTSDSMSDVLMLSKVRNFGSGSGADSLTKSCGSLSQSEAQNQRERIESGSGADSLPLMWSLWANQRLRKSEWIHSRSAPNPLPIRSLEDPLPKVMWSVNQMCHKSLTSCWKNKAQFSRIMTIFTQIGSFCGSRIYLRPDSFLHSNRVNP